MTHSVRWHVQLVRQLADGGAPVLTETSGQCPVTIRQMVERSGCFCTRGAVLGSDVICLLPRWQKPHSRRGRLWHQEGVPGVNWGGLPRHYRSIILNTILSRCRSQLHMPTC